MDVHRVPVLKIKISAPCVGNGSPPRVWTLVTVKCCKSRTMELGLGGQRSSRPARVSTGFLVRYIDWSVPREREFGKHAAVQPLLAAPRPEVRRFCAGFDELQILSIADFEFIYRKRSHFD